jgi:hypothetical protein
VFHVLNATDLLRVGYKLASSFALHISVREVAASLVGTTFIHGYDFATSM